jgi:hypothetical protein
MAQNMRGDQKNTNVSLILKVCNKDGGALHFSHEEHIPEVLVSPTHLTGMGTPGVGDVCMGSLQYSTCSTGSTAGE